MPMNRGKSISVFLPNGNAEGILRCGMSNWIGVVYRVPRTELEAGQTRTELKFNGVYFLLGEDPDTGRSAVYVGQAQRRKSGEGILTRLVEHTTSDEAYWTEAIVITTINDQFGPTEISYLENRFYAHASLARRYTIKNRIDPTPGNLVEAKQCEMDEFIDFAMTVVRTMGYRLFDPVATINANSENLDTFFLKRVVDGKEVHGRGIRTPEGFVVLRGSTVSPAMDPGIPVKIKEARHDATIVDNVLQEDVLLSSPSYAAMFVVGKSENGQTAWRTENGTTLKDFEAQMAVSLDTL